MAAHLFRKLADVDRFHEIAGETGGKHPIGIAEVVGQRAQSDDRYMRRASPVPERARDVRAVHVREMQVEQDQVRHALRRERDALPAACGFERPEPGSAQHIPRKLQILLVVVDDEDERASRIRPAGTRAWRVRRHRPILTP